MEDLILYLLKSAGLMSLFFVCYYFLLKNDTNFNTNRFFLIAGVFTSMLLPFLKLTRIIEVESTALPFSLENISTIPQSTLGNEAYEIDWWQIAGLVYLVGLGSFLLKFFIELFSLLKLIYTNKASKEDDFYVIRKAGNTQPFSFFKYIVLDPALHSPAEQELILKHERSHARQWHSIDQLLTSLSAYVLWFNPLTWLYRKSVVQNLEYLADREVISTQVSKMEYQKTLLKISVGDFQPAFTNQFYQSFIKKRIMMLNKNSSQKSNFWKTGLILPFLLVFVFSFNVKTEAQIKSPEVVSASSSFHPDMHFAIITKDATDEDLEKLEKEFSKNGITLKFTTVERSAKGEITNLLFTFEDEKKRKTGSFSQSDPLGIPGLTLTSKEGKISIKTVSAPQEKEEPLSGIGNSPLYIIAGKEYSTSQLAEKYIVIKGEWNVLKPKEAEEKFGSKAKDGAIIISKSNIVEDFKEALKDMDLSQKSFSQNYIQVKKDVPPVLLGVKTKINRNFTPPTSASETHKPEFQIKNKADGKNLKFIIPDVQSYYEESDDIIAIETEDEKNQNYYLQKNRPLVIVEGKIQGEDFNISSIEPSTIKRLIIITKEKAIKKYDKRGENGAIEIDLKSKEELKSTSSSSDKKNEFAALGVGYVQYDETKKKTATLSVRDADDANPDAPKPLYVVNEKRMPKDFKAESIPADQIESIRVLKGEHAIDKYGEKAKNGVFEITLLKK